MAARHKRQGKPMSQIVLPQLRRAAVVANGRATRFALDETRRTISAAGLGRLGGAVGAISTAQRSRIKSRTGGAVGIIFARGSDESRANLTLLAYSEGASIYPSGGKKWLAYPTKAIPSRTGRRQKMTPALYRASGLVNTIGKLRFVPDRGNPRQAYLVASKVTVSRRTGRAKAFTGKVPRGADRKDVVAFVLLRFTRRAQRFDQGRIMRRATDQVAVYAADFLAGGADQ